MKAFHSATLSVSLLLAACGSSDDKRVIIADDVDTTDGWGGGEVSYDTGGGFDSGDGSGQSELPVDFAAPCESSSDCSTGICYQNGSQGNICTIGCFEGCPIGFGCVAVNSGADVSYMCVPRPDTGDVVGDGDGGGTISPNPDGADSDDGGDGSNGDGDGDDSSGDTDSGGPDTNDPTTPGTGTACDAPPGVGSDNLFAESADWSDCIAGGCGNPLPVSSTLRALDLRAGGYTGARGLLDDLPHSYTFQSNATSSGPDVDVLAILANPRTMLEFAVVKDASTASIDPVISVSDGFAVRTYNSDVNDSNSCARTTFAYPYVSGLPIYVIIEDAINYERYTPTGYLGGTVGGPGYGWILRVRQTPFQPIELGTHPLNGTISFEDELTLGGEARYYRVYAPGTVRPKIRLEPISAAPFAPFMAGINTIGGQLVWERTAQRGSDGKVFLGAGALKACNRPEDCSGGSCFDNLCSSANAEFIFAVSDFNGASPTNGAFKYRVSIELTP